MKMQLATSLHIFQMYACALCLPFFWTIVAAVLNLTWNEKSINLKYMAINKKL